MGLVLQSQWTYWLGQYCSNQEPSTINHQPSTINHQPSTINHQPSTEKLLKHDGDCNQTQNGIAVSNH